MTDNPADKLTEKQKAFAELFILGKTNIRGEKIETHKLYNATQAYMLAYDYDQKDHNKLREAAVNGYHNLRKPNIEQYVKMLQEQEGLNDQYIDGRTKFWADSKDPAVSLKALGELNKVRARLNKKEIETKVNLKSADLEGGAEITIRHINNDA